MTLVAEPLTLFAVMIPRSQVDISLPWMIGATVVCAIGWALITLDMRHHRRSEEERGAKKAVVQPQRAA
jgi:hypothetical protein